MNNPLRSPEDYELCLRHTRRTQASVRSTTFVFMKGGATLVRVTGD